MSLSAAIGISQSIDAYSAAQQATRQALDQMGNSIVSMAIVFAAQEFEIQGVLGGVSSLLGNTPQWGFSTSVPLAGEGPRPHSVVVALLGGDDLKAQVHWSPGYAQDSASSARKLIQLLPDDPWLRQALLLVVDGVSGDANQLCSSLQAVPPNQLPSLAGCLAGGDFHLGKTYQIGGSQTGSGSLSAAYLSGRIRMGVGKGHGWLPAGPFFHITRSNGVWIRALDGKSAAERYSGIFGSPVRDWAFPPLTDLVRLYPLEIESAGSSPRTVRAPLHVEADGSFRMQTPIAEGTVGHLLIGSLDHCLDAAREAARQAQADLRTARPFFGLVLADVAWQMLFASQPGAEISAVREAIGLDVPLAGAYTLGHIAGSPPQLLNQHIFVVLLGETED
ncbi:MAG TPA: FIST N-terminal domain-containing protein [Anaerolineaceae bacterium]|nr:FIST N-terminal domain-containing protein [Anaerolineaceae bacterium]